MLGLTLLLSSGVILALGRGCVRWGVPLGRTLRRLRRLLWLSLLFKLGLVAGYYALGTRFTPPEAALLLGVSVALVMTEFALLFRWLYPIEKVERDLPATRSEYVAARLSLVWDTLAPILTLGLGALTLSYVVGGQYRDEGIGGVLIACGMGLSAWLIGAGLMRRPAPLPVRAVPVETHLLEAAQRMGRELGVSVRALLVLDGTRLRMANAFALSGGRIAITDCLLASLTERELLAVLAHEVAHLAQRRRLVRLWLLQLATGVGIAVALAPLWERLPPWGLIVWIGLIALAMTLPVLHLRRHHEREADAFAASQFGIEPLESALRKIAQLHRRDPDAPGDAIHPALQQRLQFLQRLYRV